MTEGVVSFLKIIEIKHNTCSGISNKFFIPEDFFTFAFIRKTSVQVKKCLLFKLRIFLVNNNCLNSLINYNYIYN